MNEYSKRFTLSLVPQLISIQILDQEYLLSTSISGIPTGMRTPGKTTPGSDGQNLIAEASRRLRMELHNRSKIGDDDL